MENEYEKSKADVIQWARCRGLLPKGNPLKQTLKTASEVGELCDAVAKGDTDDIIDAIGDVQVCLIILCEQLGMDYNACLKIAYNEIKNRTGKNVAGVFVKDES